MRTYLFKKRENSLRKTDLIRRRLKPMAKNKALSLVSLLLSFGASCPEGVLIVEKQSKHQDATIRSVEQARGFSPCPGAHRLKGRMV